MFQGSEEVRQEEVDPWQTFTEESGGVEKNARHHLALRGLAGRGRREEGRGREKGEKGRRERGGEEEGRGGEREVGGGREREEGKGKGGKEGGRGERKGGGEKMDGVILMRGKERTKAVNTQSMGIGSMSHHLLMLQAQTETLVEPGEVDGEEGLPTRLGGEDSTQRP